MGNNGSKTNPTSFPLRRWPTPGTSASDMLENINFVREDVDRWYTCIGSDQIDATTLNEDVIYRFINRLWKHIEQTVEDTTALHYQQSLQRAYDHIARYSRGKSIKSDRARRTLRLDLMHCALELTASVLVLQQEAAEGYQRRRQSLPIMAWAMVDALVRTCEADVDAVTPWSGGLITRNAETGEWKWKCGPVYTNNRRIESLSEGESLLLLAVDLRKGLLQYDEQQNENTTLQTKDRSDMKPLNNIE